MIHNKLGQDSKTQYLKSSKALDKQLLQKALTFALTFRESISQICLHFLSLS